jgi:hypothetical protein
LKRKGSSNPEDLQQNKKKEIKRNNEKTREMLMKRKLREYGLIGRD